MLVSCRLYQAVDTCNIYTLGQFRFESKGVKAERAGREPMFGRDNVVFSPLVLRSNSNSSDRRLSPGEGGG